MKLQKICIDRYSKARKAGKKRKNVSPGPNNFNMLKSHYYNFGPNNASLLKSNLAVGGHSK